MFGKSSLKNFDPCTSCQTSGCLCKKQANPDRTIRSLFFLTLISHAEMVVQYVTKIKLFCQLMPESCESKNLKSFEFQKPHGAKQNIRGLFFFFFVKRVFKYSILPPFLPPFTPTKTQHPPPPPPKSICTSTLTCVDIIAKLGALQIYFTENCVCWEGVV